MPYNGSTNGSAGGGGGVLVVSDGPQNKKIRTGVQQSGDGDVHMIARTTTQSQQQPLMNKSNDDLRRKRPESTRPNHILLFTIINPFYPITVVSRQFSCCCCSQETTRQPDDRSASFHNGQAMPSPHSSQPNFSAKICLFDG
ncbi:uncharacterized protein LOC133338146, partial [Musca vetustissima]|uniref:uncharacterized protein LOC133338146 n=1 Tax=Musca vetustissima TaxID=27455 RepID=UPI002AB62E39